jgi:hypothetical protein
VLAALTTAASSTLATSTASAQGPPALCSAWDVEYALTAKLQLSETPMGQGDGEYPIGPGTLTLRYEDVGGKPGGRVKLLSYQVRQAFSVASKNLFWTTQVSTDATTRKTPDACGAAAEGQLTGTTIGWSSPVTGFVTDGFLTCDGTFCGKFGAPPPGKSPLHLGPSPVTFVPFRFSADMQTFAMSSTFVAKTDAPKQTSHLTLAGRETRKTCAALAPCK